MKAFVVTAVLSAVAFPAIAAPASAFSVGVGPEVTVRFSDLDLTRPAGADAMMARIGQAVKVACSGFSTREQAQMVHYKACMSETMAAAVKQVNAPLVTARSAGTKVGQLAAR